MIGCVRQRAGPPVMHHPHVPAQQDRSSHILPPPLPTSHTALHRYAKAATAAERRASRIFLHVLQQPRNQSSHCPRQRETQTGRLWSILWGASDLQTVEVSVSSSHSWQGPCFCRFSSTADTPAGLGSSLSPPIPPLSSSPSLLSVLNNLILIRLYSFVKALPLLCVFAQPAHICPLIWIFLAAWVISNQAHVFQPSSPCRFSSSCQKRLCAFLIVAIPPFGITSAAPCPTPLILV